MSYFEPNEWKQQLKASIRTIEQLEKLIDLTQEERAAILNTTSRWSITPYFANLMDKGNPDCPIRKQVLPSALEEMDELGIPDYLVWKENRSKEENRPDTIGRQYRDRIAFTITDTCGIYCRYCLRREATIDRTLRLSYKVDEGLQWIRENPEVRDVIITGGDPFILTDEKLEYVVCKLREIPHVEVIRFGTRLPVVLPHRITDGLKKAIGGYHRVPVWVNIQANHPKEVTDLVAKAVYELLSCGVSVGNQAVLLKGINDDVETFKSLHLKLLSIRVRPYYLYYCEYVPGADHFRTPIERGSELILQALRGHTSGLAQPMYVIATNIGKINLMQPDSIVEKTDKEYILQNYEGKRTSIPLAN